MLVIRMQRTGRKGHAMFRVVVQDSRRTPTSGKVVASLGNYDPHNKVVNINKEKAQFYLEHGAQPSDRAALLLKKEGVKLPKWVNVDTDKKRTVRNVDKRRSTRPEEPKEEVPAEEPTVDTEEAQNDAGENDEKPQATTPEAKEATEASEPTEESADTKE